MCIHNLPTIKKYGMLGYSDVRNGIQGQLYVLLLLADWTAQWIQYLAAEWEVGKLNSSLCFLGEQPACTVMGELHSPGASPKEGKVKTLLIILYLGNPGKGCHRSELTL